MLNRLELEISEVEKRIGDKMVRADYIRTRRCLSSWGLFKGQICGEVLFGTCARHDVMNNIMGWIL